MSARFQLPNPINGRHAQSWPLYLANDHQRSSHLAEHRCHCCFVNERCSRKEDFLVAIVTCSSFHAYSTMGTPCNQPRFINPQDKAEK